MRNKTPFSWSPPPYSTEIVRQYFGKIERDREMHWVMKSTISNDRRRLLCDGYLFDKFTNKPIGACQRDAIWWHPNISLCHCDKHVAEERKEELWHAWLKFRLERLIVRWKL